NTGASLGLGPRGESAPTRAIRGSTPVPKLASAPAVEEAGPVERVARIADVIGGAGERNEKLRRLAPEVVDALHEQRLFRLLLPRAFGGDGVHLVTWVDTIE